MQHDPPYPRCPICSQPVDDCASPLGAHLLCLPTAECRHELCLLLAGDVYEPSINSTVRKVAS